MVAFMTEKAQLLMNSEGYLWSESVWAVRARRDIVRWDIG